jgi:Lon protease-like protein
MTDAFEKVRGVRQLPLFPLPIVMLPGEVVPLHIFEPRYRKLLADALDGNRLFGLSFNEAAGIGAAVPEIGHLGCVAEVREAQTMPDGRSNILTLGVIRYRLEDYVETDEPYLVGQVAFFEDDIEDEDDLSPLANETAALFTRVANAAQEMSGDRARLPKLPEMDAQQLSFLIAAAFNFENEFKLELAEMLSTRQRLERLQGILSEAVERGEEGAKIKKAARTNGHSKKKINID